jgi:hypothetical protein
MFFSFGSGNRKPRARRTQWAGSTVRLSLESLEERAVPSGTSGGSGTLSGGGPGPSTQPTGVVSQSGGLGISGPGYPLPPGVTVTGSSGGSAQTQQTIVLVPLSGSPGGPSTSLAVVPMPVTGGGSGSTPGGSTKL